MKLSATLAGTLAFLIALVAISYIVEALRSVPERPDKLAWAPEVSVQYVDIGGAKVRYIRTGAGPNLVLLHTLRTQLDIFQGLIPQLARHFTVYAYDYPGHGWSDIPEASYAPEDFYKWTAAFLDKLDIRQATVAGVSIGATIALVLAARDNPRVARVVAVNSYDYGPAVGGVRTSSLTARLVLTRTLLGQRVIGIALGYEDLVDHDQLRHDPVPGVLMGKLKARRKECAALAGKSTLSRLEHAPEEGPARAPPRYHKISHDAQMIERLLVDIALESEPAPPMMVIDLDATDAALHGHQEGRVFHGYYDCYCYLPLFVFWGRHLLAATLRSANADAAAGSVETVARIVAQVRARWPKTTIVIRAGAQTAKYGTVYLNTNSSAPSEAGENCSRVKFVWDGNGTNFSKAAVQNAVEKIGKRWLLLTNDYVWGHTTSAATKAQVEKAGGQIIDNLLVPQNTRDFASYLLKVQQAKPDVVATAVGGDDIKALRQQVSELKLEDKAAWINNQQDWPDVWGAPETLFGVFGTTWYHKLPLPGVAEFVKRWQTAYPQSPIPVPGNVSYNGYMATRELLRAVERAGSTNNLKVIKQLEGHKMSAADRMQHFDAYIDPATHQVQQTIYLARRNAKPADKTDLFELISWTQPEFALDDAAPAKCKLKPDSEVPSYEM